MANLESMRADVEAIDNKIVTLLADRVDLCCAIGRIKVASGIPAHLPERVQLVLSRWTTRVADRQIDETSVRNICQLVIDECCKAQLEVMSAPNRD